MGTVPVSNVGALAVIRRAVHLPDRLPRHAARVPLPRLDLPASR
jgi:hypothetical protein